MSNNKKKAGLLQNSWKMGFEMFLYHINILGDKYINCSYLVIIHYIHSLKSHTEFLKYTVIVRIKNTIPKECHSINSSFPQQTIMFPVDLTLPLKYLGPGLRASAPGPHNVLDSHTETFLCSFFFYFTNLKNAAQISSLSQNHGAVQMRIWEPRE